MPFQCISLTALIGQFFQFYHVLIQITYCYRNKVMIIVLVIKTSTSKIRCPSMKQVFQLLLTSTLDLLCTNVLGNFQITQEFQNFSYVINSEFYQNPI